MPPDRPPTHEALDIDQIWDLSDELEARLQGGPITPEILRTVAAEASVPLTHAYVAGSVDPGIAWERRHAVALHVCVGGCQAWGAVDVLGHLISVRDAREAEGRPSFDLVTHPCLNACDRAPSVFSTGPHGQALHPDATPASVDEVVEVLLATT